MLLDAQSGTGWKRRAGRKEAKQTLIMCARLLSALVFELPTTRTVPVRYPSMLLALSSSNATVSSFTMEAEKIFAPNAQANANALANIKFLSACFTGAIAGILGLQKQYGFALFLISSALTALCIYVIHMPKAYSRSGFRAQSSQASGPSLRLYAPAGAWDLLNPGQENVFSFLLAWTLFFGA